jgi:hypothetical protein
VSDRFHPLDDSGPYTLLKASAIFDAVVADDLIRTAMEALVNELLGVGIYTVLAHDGAESVSPRWEGRPHGPIEIEEEASSWGFGGGEVCGRHGVDTITLTEVR